MLSPDSLVSEISHIEEHYICIMNPSIPILNFQGRSSENVEDFILSVRVNFGPKAAAYTNPADNAKAQLVSLKIHLKGAAAEWLARQPLEVVSN